MDLPPPAISDLKWNSSDHLGNFEHFPFKPMVRDIGISRNQPG